MIKKTIRYTTLADRAGWDCYYALQDHIDGEVRMWVENNLLIMEYDTLVIPAEEFGRFLNEKEDLFGKSFFQ